MDHGIYDGPMMPSESMNGGRSASLFLQPRYNSKAVQEALQHLASVDMIELCNEAKVEHCRATRDLRSCGRPVESILISCRHASLCAECSQRYDICPVCRTPLPKSGNRLQLRLYYQCVEVHLIAKMHDGRSQEKEDDEEAHLTADVRRLYSLFDVALENNLSCLVGQYVTDVCMDETAVSSDPVIAFLLDEVVVKDWCKRTFRSIISELQGIYILEVDELKSRLELVLKCSAKLSGLSHVLEVLELSFEGTLSAKLDDLQYLHESVLKTKQHAEMMIWCVRHQFLENVRSRYTDLFSWRKLFRERKAAAIERAWPESGESFMESMKQDNGTLFIEDALLNLDTQKGVEQQGKFELEIASLQKNGGSSLLRCKIEGLVGSYPFENLRSTVDILFLYGSCDMVVAKQAIFLYYLFDRHWKIPDEEWRHIVDDFAASFGITRHSLLESLTFYLLDDHTMDALKEACRLLPEISGPESHPKIARVLLERQNPDAALMFLRWSGRDGGTELVSLCEAVTAIRVRVECGLLTEAFMYQRNLWMKVKERQLKGQQPADTSTENMKGGSLWVEWVDVLVTEICCLCIRRHLVDRMIELPWNSYEEKHLHKCLFDCAVGDPSSTVGSFLVVFYLQRYRYIDAYHVDQDLQQVELDFRSQNNISEAVSFRMRSASNWRAGLINKSIGLLPEVQQRQLRAGKLPENVAFSPHFVKNTKESDASEPLEQAPVLPTPSASSSSLVLHIDQDSTSHNPSFSGIPKSDRSLTCFSHIVLDNFASSSHSRSHPSLMKRVERGSKCQFSFNFGEFNSMSPLVKDIHPRTSSRAFQADYHQNGQQLEFFTPEAEQNGFLKHSPKISSPYTRRIMAKPARTTPSTSVGLLNDDYREIYRTAPDKMDSLGVPDRTQAINSSSDDLMDIKWCHEENGSAMEDFNRNGGARWRSDETSDDEEQSPAPARTWTRRSRRGRLSRR